MRNRASTPRAPLPSDGSHPRALHRPGLLYAKRRGADPESGLTIEWLGGLAERMVFLRLLSSNGRVKYALKGGNDTTR